MSSHHWLRSVGVTLLVGLLSALAAVGWASRTAAEKVTLSPVFGDRRIGPAFPERRGLTTGGRPAGEMDDMAAYTRPETTTRSGFDPEQVHPDVRAFYEQTDAWEMAYRVRWHPGFRLGARAAVTITSAIEQLNLPGPGNQSVHRLRSRFARLRPGVDPREGVRAWVRTDHETGEAVFVALYGSHQRGDERFVNIAAPLPGTNLSTVLKLDHLPLADRETSGVTLTTAEEAGLLQDGGELEAGDGGDSGLYLNTPVGAFALPMEQRFRVWPVDTPEGPEPLDPRAQLVATHEMWLTGRQFLTIAYAMWRREDDN